MYITITYFAEGEESKGTLGHEIESEEELIGQLEEAYDFWLAEIEQTAVTASKTTSQVVKGAPWIDDLKYETTYTVRAMLDDTWELLDEDGEVLCKFKAGGIPPVTDWKTRKAIKGHFDEQESR